MVFFGHENDKIFPPVVAIQQSAIVVSPYQLIVHATTPGKQRELTDDRREKLLSKNPDLTDAEMLEILGWTYEPCQTICFDQDGEMLYSDMEMAGRAGFAVQRKKIRHDWRPVPVIRERLFLHRHTYLSPPASL